MRFPRTALYAAVAGALVVLACLFRRSPDADSRDDDPIRANPVDLPEPPPTLLGVPPRPVARGRVVAAPHETAAAREVDPADRTEARGWEMRFDVIDAMTGATVEGAELEEGARLPAYAARVNEDLRETARGDSTRTIGHQTLWAPGKPSGLDLTLASPPGYERRGGWRVGIVPSRYATTLRYVEPLRPEIPLTLRIVDADGRPAPEAMRFGVEVGGTICDAAVFEPRGSGVFLVRGAPWMPGETVHVQAGRTPRDASGGAAEQPVSETLPKPQWGATLPFGMPAPLEGSIALRADDEGWILDHLETDYDSERVRWSDLAAKRLPEAGTGALLVAARRRDGSPAANALVRVADGREGRLDANGRGRFTGAPLGTYDVTLVEAGIIPVRASVVVAKDQTTKVDLIEPTGGRVEVRVVDATGRGLPCAWFHVTTPSGGPWIDLVDGVQRLDAFVDPTGQRVLENVEPGDVTIHARYGSRHGSTSVRVSEGAGTRAEIVVR